MLVCRIFCHLWQSGEEAAKKGAVRPHFWGWYCNKQQRWISPSCWGTFDTCVDGPCSRAFVRLGRGTEVYLAAVHTCVHNKQALPPPLLGERRHKWRQSIRRGIAPGGCSFELYAHQTGCHFERHTVAAAEMPCFRLFDCRRQTIFKRGKMPTARIAGHTACHKPPRVSCLETPRALSRYKTPKE